MKNLTKITFLWLLLFGIGLSAQAQKKVEEAQIVYGVEIDTDQMEPMAAAMMGDVTMTIAFKQPHALVEMDMGIMSTKVIMDENANSGLMLMDMMGMKIGVPMTEEEMDKAQEESKDKPEVKVEKLSGTEKIAGYNCKRARLTSENQVIEVWYTEEIKPLTADIDMTRQYKELDGFPLKMEIIEGEMPMTMTASEVITKNVKAEIFSMEIPDGYSEMTMKELEAMGSMGR